MEKTNKKNAFKAKRQIQRSSRQVEETDVLSSKDDMV